MHYRYLRDLEVPALGLGCMGMSEFYGQSSDKAAMATIQAALDLGINFFDTADMYGSGANEMLLAKALAGQRDKAIIATKFGIVRDPDNASNRGFNGSAAYVQASCENSLRRLKTDMIDLYYLHRLDPNTPIEETVTAMAGLVKAGKVRYIGLSEVSAEMIRRAEAIHPITAVQTEYSLMSRAPETNGVLTICQALNIGFVPYSPLSRGLLSANIGAQLGADDFRLHLPRFQAENLKQNQKLAFELTMIANDLRCTLAQLSLAWVLAQGKNVVPIPGTRHVNYLQDNAKACDIHLDTPILQNIESILQSHPVRGSRYPKAFMQAFQLEDEL